MNSLRGKKALVTGGASGIGKAIVEELSEQGAEVIIHYFSSRDSAQSLAESIHSRGGKAAIVGGDLTQEEAVREMMGFVKETSGGLDVLVNNAGDLVRRQGVEGMTMAHYREVMAVNMESMFLVSREAIPLLKDRPDGASIVNLSSLAGRQAGRAGSIIYATAKGAVLAWTRSLALELAAFHIRVNAVAPGLILGSRFHATHTAAEAQRQTIAGIPLGRAGTCEDVARAVAFMASEYNGFITGATLDINGGVAFG